MDPLNHNFIILYCLYFFTHFIYLDLPRVTESYENYLNRTKPLGKY